jgi:NAD(P)-dependent dehydrogenase (short-subunit alcohol dehydrogenase family)
VGNTWTHYGRSKLANLLFTAELSRRLRVNGESTIAVAAHPGWTRSNLIGTGAALGGRGARARVSRIFGSHVGQAASTGAWPSLYAATEPDVRSGQFIGPSHMFQLFGPPKVVRPAPRAGDTTDAVRLWEISEELTDVHYRLPAPA